MKCGEDITKHNLEGNSNLPTKNTKINYKLFKMSLRLSNQQRKCWRMMQKKMYLVYERWKLAKSEQYQGKRKLRRRLTCMAILWISSLVKYLTSLFFHSISVSKLCGLFLCRKSKPRTEKLTTAKKECSNLAEKLKNWPRVDFLPFSSNLKSIMWNWYKQDKGPTQQS